MSYEKLLYAGVFLVTAIVIFNFLNTQDLSSLVEQKLLEAKEAQVLPKISLTSIRVDCQECLDLSQLENAIMTSITANFSQRSLIYGSQEASNYIAKYNIQKLPALVVEGNVSLVLNSQLGQVFDQRNGALVFEGFPPYVDALSGEKKGVVRALLVGSCEGCYNFTPMLNGLASNGVYISSLENISVDSSPVEVSKLPTLLLSEDVEEYPQIVAAMAQLNISKKSGYYIFDPLPPYVESETGQLRGNVSVFYIEKEGCSECLSSSRLKELVDALRMYVSNESYLNESSGAEFISSYNIEVLPTIVIKGDVSAYDRLLSSWPSVGNVFEDALVLTNLSMFGEDIVTYNLSEDAVVRPEFREIRVEGTEFSFNPSSISLKAGEKVRITFVNVGNAPHDFTIDELGIQTSTLGPGQSEAITFTAPTTGTFSFYCSVPGHREAGMEGTLEVVQ